MGREDDRDKTRCLAANKTDERRRAPSGLNTRKNNRRNNFVKGIERIRSERKTIECEDRFLVHVCYRQTACSNNTLTRIIYMYSPTHIYNKDTKTDKRHRHTYITKIQMHIQNTKIITHTHKKHKRKQITTQTKPRTYT